MQVFSYIYLEPEEKQLNLLWRLIIFSPRGFITIILLSFSALE